MHRRSIAGPFMNMSQHPLRNSFRRCDENRVRYNSLSSFPRKRESRARGEISTVALDPLSSQTKCNTCLRCCNGKAI